VRHEIHLGVGDVKVNRQAVERDQPSNLFGKFLIDLFDLQGGAYGAGNLGEEFLFPGQGAGGFFGPFLFGDVQEGDDAPGGFGDHADRNKNLPFVAFLVDKERFVAGRGGGRVPAPDFVIPAHFFPVRMADELRPFPADNRLLRFPGNPFELFVYKGNRRVLFQNHRGRTGGLENRAVMFFGVFQSDFRLPAFGDIADEGEKVFLAVQRQVARRNLDGDEIPLPVSNRGFEGQRPALGYLGNPITEIHGGDFGNNLLDRKGKKLLPRISGEAAGLFVDQDKPPCGVDPQNGDFGHGHRRKAKVQNVFRF